MTALDAIKARTSYRDKFESTPIPKSDLTKIMEAGLSAPSGCNKQTTSLIAVDDPELLAKLHSVITPPASETAPAMICVLTQKIIAYKDRYFNVQDYSAAIQNMLLAAVALGYQSCWYEGHITDTDAIGKKMADILNIPDDYELVCFLPIGIASQPPKPADKKEFHERAWFNGFGEVTIKKAAQKDSEIIHKMQVESFTPVLEKYQDNETSPAAETLERFKERFYTAKIHHYLIELKNETIGYVRVLMLPGNVYKLSSLFIITSHQGKGYAQQAIKQIEKLYPQATKFVLTTIKQEKKLCHLYKKLSYTPKREEHIKSGMDLIHYEKIIKRD